MTEKCRIEFVYRVWDCANGASVIIQDGDDEGLYQFGDEVFSVEQIPGIIRVLEILKEDFDQRQQQYHFTPEEMSRQRAKFYTCDPPTPIDPTANARSGRPDPPF